MIAVQQPVALVDAVDLLNEMLQIPSVSTPEAQLGQWLHRRLRGLGFAARRDEVGNVVAYWGSGPREVVLLGHLDTVPPRGPLAAAITAITRQPARGGCRITLVAAVGEGGSMRGARHLATRRAPDALIALEPSRWDGVMVGANGSLRLRYRFAQPAGHDVGSQASAADRAVAFIRRVQDHAVDWNQGRSFLDRLEARVLRFHADHDGMRDRASLTLGFRVPPGYDLDALRSRLDGWRESADVSFDSAAVPIRTQTHTRLTRAFVEAIRQQGGTPRLTVKDGTSEINILVPIWNCPAGAYGPGDSRLDRPADEAIDIFELEKAVEVLTAVLKNL
ncbi:MAG TPA: M20/M25/M40 family metallo-hydrolase [Candidatus Dormibacteraeota bacterium]